MESILMLLLVCAGFSAFAWAVDSLVDWVHTIRLRKKRARWDSECNCSECDGRCSETKKKGKK
jgi:hypothetical protein